MLLVREQARLIPRVRAPLGRRRRVVPGVDAAGGQVAAVAQAALPQAALLRAAGPPSPPAPVNARPRNGPAQGRSTKIATEGMVQKWKYLCKSKGA